MSICRSLFATLLLFAGAPPVAALPAGGPVEGPAAAAPAETGGQRPGSFTGRSEHEYTIGYLLYRPAEYFEKEGARWPLIVHLHGGGGRGSDLERLKVYPLPAQLEKDPSFPFVVVSPQCPEGQFWDHQAEQVMGLVGHLITTLAIDPARVYLVGHSMGGYGTWYLAYRFPDRFAAIAPISGPGVSWWTANLVDVPVWAFHGALDDAVPVAETEAMVKQLRELGGDPKVTIYPDKGHVLREPFGDELWSWLLEHRIPAGSGEVASAQTERR